jgi:outer membrane protein TolC
VVVSGSWGYDRASNIGYSVQDQSSGVGVEVRWDLYTGGARAARAREAESRRAEAAAQLRRLQRSVEAQVRQATIGVADAQRQIVLRRERLQTALRSRQTLETAYAAGKETLLRLNEAQRDYITSDADLALARIRLRQAWSDLISASGVHRDAPVPNGPEQGGDAGGDRSGRDDGDAREDRPPDDEPRDPRSDPGSP